MTAASHAATPCQAGGPGVGVSSRRVRRFARTGRPGGHAESGDAGSASVWVLSMAGVVFLAGLAVALVGVAVVARHRAGAAADLAAIAGAATLGRNAALTDVTPANAAVDACSVSGQVAAANGATVTRCDVDGLTLSVVVAVRVGGLARFGIDSVTAAAKAGVT